MNTTASDTPPVTVSKGNFKRPSKLRRYLLWGGVVLAIVATGLTVWAVRTHQSNENRQKQASLEYLLDLYINQQEGKNQPIIDTATQLINGANSGKFKMTSAKLGEIYLDRASANESLGKNQQAINDYAKAASVSSQARIAGLQGEIKVRHTMGARKELIPLLQQLIEATKKSTNPIASSMVTQYQANIDTLQKGQDIEL